MKMKLRLQAGNPNDANRDYVPMGIKGTDMTVNENGNNSQVYPERLQECTGVLADSLIDHWYEYVPASYDGNRQFSESGAKRATCSLHHILGMQRR